MKGASCRSSSAAGFGIEAGALLQERFRRLRYRASRRALHAAVIAVTAHAMVMPGIFAG
jgi:hypothetical protein